MIIMMRRMCVGMVLALSATIAVRADVAAQGTYSATDTLKAILKEPEHKAVLSPIMWEPGKFEVKVEKPDSAAPGENAMVSFPSPLPMWEQAEADRVALEWFAAQDESGRPVAGPAVVIIPETDSRRIAARTLAMGLRALKVHAFVLQPPGYGRRSAPKLRTNPHQFLPRSRQTVADARRARDAIAALPGMAGAQVHLAGISLGGFLATVTATLDDGYDQTFIMLAGGDLAGVISNGQRDAATFRERFIRAGFTQEQINDQLRMVEPLRVADRLRPESTWLFTGMYDTVVPTKNSDELAAAAHLPADHRIVYPTDHYTAALMLPDAARSIVEKITKSARE